MSKTLLVAAGGALTTTANTTSHTNITGRPLTLDTNESLYEIVWRTAGNFTNFQCRLTANGITSNSTLRLRKNTATDCNNVITLTASTTGLFEDTTSNDVVTAGDRFVARFTPGAATGTVTFNMIGIVFDADTANLAVTKYAGGRSSTTAASTTTFACLSGGAPFFTTTETNMKVRMRKAGTLKNGHCYVSANSRTTDTLMRSRKNGANGNLLVTLTGSTTGRFEDTSNSDTVSAAEDWNFSFTTGTGTQNITCDIYSCEFHSSADIGHLCTGLFSPISVTDNTTRYCGIMGLIEANATEANTQTKAQHVFRFSELIALVTQNDTSSASTIDLRVATASSALTLSVTGNTTGLFNNTSNTVDVAAGNALGYRVSVPAVSGTHTIGVAWIACNSLLGEISKSLTLKYNVVALERVSKSNTLKYHIEARISKSNTLKYNIIGRISKSNTLKYHINSLISKTNILKWNIQARISKSNILKWNIEARISKSNTLKYDIVGRISKSNTLKYHVNSLISKTNILKWNINARISKSNILKWNLQARISKSNILKWNLIGRITKSNVLKWNIQARVSLPTTLKYNIQARISKATTLLYNILGLERVSKSNTLKYNILARVSKSTTLKYNINARISKQISLLYNIIGRITKSNVLKWHLQARVTKSNVLKWNLQARVSKSNILKWDILQLGRVSKPTTLLYNIVARISKATTLKYNIGSLVSPQAAQGPTTKRKQQRWRQWVQRLQITFRSLVRSPTTITIRQPEPEPEQPEILAVTRLSKTLTIHYSIQAPISLTASIPPPPPPPPPVVRGPDNQPILTRAASVPQVTMQQNQAPVPYQVLEGQHMHSEIAATRLPINKSRAASTLLKLMILLDLESQL